MIHHPSHKDHCAWHTGADRSAAAYSRISTSSAAGTRSHPGQPKGHCQEWAWPSKATVTRTGDNPGARGTHVTSHPTHLVLPCARTFHESRRCTVCELLRTARLRVGRQQTEPEVRTKRPYRRGAATCDVLGALHRNLRLAQTCLPPDKWRHLGTVPILVQSRIAITREQTLRLS